MAAPPAGSTGRIGEMIEAMGRWFPVPCIQERELRTDRTWKSVRKSSHFTFGPSPRPSPLGTGEREQEAESNREGKPGEVVRSSFPVPSPLYPGERVRVRGRTCNGVGMPVSSPLDGSPPRHRVGSAPPTICFGSTARTVRGAVPTCSGRLGRHARAIAASLFSARRRKLLPDEYSTHPKPPGG